LNQAPPELPALDLLVPVIFDELRGMAHRQLARERGPITLQTTELVHEAYLRLAGDARVTELGRAYFYAAAARAMRQVLIDAARRRKADKRGAGATVLSLDEEVASVEAYGHELLALDEALKRLESRNPRHARIVECRFFGGMSVEDTAEALDVSPRTVKSDWALARAWLYDELKGDAAATSPATPWPASGPTTSASVMTPSASTPWKRPGICCGGGAAG
jgi:RNA polymerase sigma-70 factor (ECF subfamily)